MIRCEQREREREREKANKQRPVVNRWQASFSPQQRKKVKTNEAHFEEKAAEVHSKEQPAAAEPTAEVRLKEQPASAEPATLESEITDGTRANDGDSLPLVVDIGDYFKAYMDEQSTEEGFA